MWLRQLCEPESLIQNNESMKHKVIVAAEELYETNGKKYILDIFKCELSSFP
jgi:tRNA/tmRNA/rRNA uracil-C5-methylase (TrmA/RlmC/RlmD family)